MEKTLLVKLESISANDFAKVFPNGLKFSQAFKKFDISVEPLPWLAPTTSFQMFGWEMSAAEKYDPKPAIIATGVVSGPIDACLLVPFGLPAMAIQFFIKVAQKDKLKRHVQIMVDPSMEGRVKETSKTAHYRLWSFLKYTWKWPVGF